jgi:hypothetical protein
MIIFSMPVFLSRETLYDDREGANMSIVISRHVSTFQEVLKKHNAVHCKECGRKIDRGDVSWNGAANEYGTPYSTIDIICQGCETSVAHVMSWYPSIDDFSEAVQVLDRDW